MGARCLRLGKTRGTKIMHVFTKVGGNFCENIRAYSIAQVPQDIKTLNSKLSVISVRQQPLDRNELLCIMPIAASRVTSGLTRICRVSQFLERSQLGLHVTGQCSCIVYA
jgi:hypothetical protein